MLIFKLSQMAAELFKSADSVVTESNLHKLIHETHSEILIFFPYNAK